MADPKRGRPSLEPGEPSVKVSISLPAKEFDRLCDEARRQDQSVPAVIRQALYGSALTIKGVKK